MTTRVVRASKFRHVFGTPAKNCYEDLKVTSSAWDSNYVAANPKFFALIWLSGGNSTLAVIPWSQTGKINPEIPLVAGHKGAINDIDWNPFNDNLIASASEDCTAKIWMIPDGGLKSTLTDAAQILNGHKRKVGTVLHNPVANNVLATSSADLTVKIWDIQEGKDVLTVDGHTDLILSLDWNYNGSMAATSCKDKKVRVFDPRTKTIAGEAEGHAGVKGSRVCWLNGDRLFSTGFTKSSEREYCVWDAKNLAQPLLRTTIDSSSGLLVPLYDRDTGVLFIAGKGDGNIRYFEVVDEAPYIHSLSEYKSKEPQRGLCMLPKRAVNVSECEIVRMMKVTTNKMEPISFQVPRKSDIFQPDLFPDCFTGEPSLSAEDWLGGQNENQKTGSMEHGFVKKETTVEFKPAVQTETKVLSEKELREENDKLSKRVAYLEAELIKRDARIKELEAKTQ